MGKNNFFKFPSKKTLEYILIGILFVAVLSCTMKMMNGSLNNILEGFTEYNCPEYVAGETCNLLTEDQQTPVPRPSYKLERTNTRNFAELNIITINGVEHSITASTHAACVTAINDNYDSVHAYHDDSENILYITQKGDGTNAFGGSAPVFSSEQCQPNGPVTITKEGGGIVSPANLLVTTCSWPNIQLTPGFCRSLTECNLTTINEATPPEVRQGLFRILEHNKGQIDATGTVQGDDLPGTTDLLQSLSGADFLTFLSSPQANPRVPYSYTINSPGCNLPADQRLIPDTIADCDTLRTRLGRDDSSNSPCIQGCEQQASGTCEDSARNAGCEIQDNDGSDPSCVCGPTTLNGPGTFNTLPTSFSGENNCLNSKFKGNDRNQSGLISVDNGELTDRSDEGWANNSGDGDRCFPRWPCINTMNDYLDILKKTKEECMADKTTDNWYDNDNTDNEMTVSYCQPFNQETDFNDCNNRTTKGDCEGALDPDSDSDKKICSWNPYCLPRHRGRNELTVGERTTPVAIQCQAHLHPRACQEDGNDCYWDWSLAEEINRNRDVAPTKSDVHRLDGIINPTVTDFDTANCRETNGSYVDNIKCSAYTAAITAGPGNRPYGYCPGGQELCETNDGIHGNCQYCSSLSFNKGMPDVPGSEYVGNAWAYVFPPDPDADTPNNVETGDCYKLYSN